MHPTSPGEESSPAASSPGANTAGAVAPDRARAAQRGTWAAVAALLLLLASLAAAGTLQATDDPDNGTVPTVRAYLPFVRLEPTPTATPIPFPRLVNGDLEAGPGAGWSETPETLIVRTTTIPAAARAGAGSSYVAWLGGAPGERVLSQKVFIPYVYSSQVRLKFFGYTESEETGCTNDTAGVYQVESDVPLLSVPLCQRLATNAWTQYTVDLSGLGGKLVELRFVSRLNGARNSNWFINRIALCQAGAPGC